MLKAEFINTLQRKLSGLPEEEISDRLGFYEEMIDDRMEEGLSEEEAVASIGTTDEIVSQIVSEVPLVKIARERITPKRKIKTWEIVLLALGAPLWLPLLISAFAVVLSVYITVWAAIVTLWSMFGAFVGCALGGIVSGVALLASSNVSEGIMLLGGGIALVGASVLWIYVCKYSTKGILALTKRVALGIKKSFVGKGEI